MNQNNKSIEPSSFKDSAGFVYYQNGKVYRDVLNSFLLNYNAVKSKGIYNSLIENKFLFPFKELNENGNIRLESEKIALITYPYEWGFQQMKEGAIFQLELIEKCLNQGAMLKDASPFNIQFINGNPIFIDVLSIDEYVSDKPWQAYKQFCEMFLAPLLLSAYFPENWNKELQINLEGISLKKTAALLPLKARLSSLALIHIIWHSKFQMKGKGSGEVKMPKQKVLSILSHLKMGIKELKKYSPSKQWTNYQQQLPYTTDQFQLKSDTVKQWINKSYYKLVLDIGANHSLFVNHLQYRADDILVIDNDDAVVDSLFKEKKERVSALHVDISLPSPALGLLLNERKSFTERVRPDLTLALAVIHHLFHSRNIPMNRLAELFAEYSKELIIEFVSENDEQFQLIKNVNNKHPYNKNLFEEEFEKYFSIDKVVEVKSGKRFLYHMFTKTQ